MKAVMRENKTIGMVFIVIFIFSVALTGCGGKTASGSEQSQRDTATIAASYIYDVRDMNARVGDSDYVFVANVVKKDASTETPEDGIPYTNYELQVLENIKGNLTVNETIPLKKEGGYLESEKITYVYEDDFLPEEGQLCVFLTRAGEDGTLYASGENSTILLKDAMEYDSSNGILSKKQQKRQMNSIEKNTKYQKVMDAVETQFDPTGREHFKSQYEQNVR